MSRGGMLAFIAGSVLCLPLAWRAGFRWKHMFACVAVLGLVFLLVPDQLIETTQQFFAAKVEASDQSRIALIQETWRDS